MSPQANFQWARIIREAIEDALFDLHTGLPAKVIEFHAETGTCDVQPLIKRKYLDADISDLPIVHEVPVQYPCGGGWAITFPLEKDDVVYLAFAERSLDRWKNAPMPESVDPVDASLHPLTGAIAIPGVRPKTAPLLGLAQGGLRIGKENGGVEIVITSDERIVVKGADVLIGSASATKRVALEDLLTEHNKLVAAFNAHIHQFVGTGTVGNISTPGGIPIPGVEIPTFPAPPTVLSTKTKVE